MAGRLLKWRYDRGYARLVGKWRAPRRTSYEYYYCSRPVKDVSHELAISNVVAAYFRAASRILRTSVDRQLLPDWTMVIAESVFHGEYDTGSMNHTRLRETRLNKYRGVEDNVLIVTAKGDERIEGLLEDARALKLETVSVATLADVLANPFGKIWRWPDDAEFHRIERPE